MKTAAEWIELLGLERHPEGGWFRRSYTSSTMVDGRPAMTSIYYLLEGSDFSSLHRLQMDELWNFHLGSPITIHEIDPSGTYTKTALGVDVFQHVVPAGNLFGATVDGDFALVGCAVVPGFDFAGFEIPARGYLLNEYPEHRELVLRLTRVSSADGT